MVTSWLQMEMNYVAVPLAVMNEVNNCTRFDGHPFIQKSQSILWSNLYVLFPSLQWYPGVAEFKPTDAFPIGIGKHYIEVLEVPLWGKTITIITKSIVTSSISVGVT